MPDKFDHEFVRGQVIELLYFEHPWFVPRKRLVRELDTLNISLTEQQFNSVLTYLRDKEYVEFRVVKRAGREDLYSFRITPKGIDLYDHHIDDEAIAL